MTFRRKYEEVSCPTCYAMPGQRCVSKQNGESLEEFNQKRRPGRGNYAHIERINAYKSANCKPLIHTAWPVGRSPT